MLTSNHYQIELNDFLIIFFELEPFGILPEWFFFFPLFCPIVATDNQVNLVNLICQYSLILPRIPYSVKPKKDGMRGRTSTNQLVKQSQVNLSARSNERQNSGLIKYNNSNKNNTTLPNPMNKNQT